MIYNNIIMYQPSLYCVNWIFIHLVKPFGLYFICGFDLPSETFYSIKLSLHCVFPKSWHSNTRNTMLPQSFRYYTTVVCSHPFLNPYPSSLIANLYGLSHFWLPRFDRCVSRGSTKRNLNFFGSNFLSNHDRFMNRCLVSLKYVKVRFKNVRFVSK